MPLNKSRLLPSYQLECLLSTAGHNLRQEMRLASVPPSLPFTALCLGFLVCPFPAGGLNTSESLAQLWHAAGAREALAAHAPQRSPSGEGAGARGQEDKKF